MKKDIKFKQLDDSEIDIVVKTLNFRQRNNILKEYIDVNKYLKEKDKSDNIIEYIKSDKSILDFQFDILKTSLNINVDDLEPEDADKLFEEHIDFIIKGGGSKN